MTKYLSKNGMISILIELVWGWYWIKKKKTQLQKIFENRSVVGFLAYLKN